MTYPTHPPAVTGVSEVLVDSGTRSQGADVDRGSVPSGMTRRRVLSVLGACAVSPLIYSLPDVAVAARTGDSLQHRINSYVKRMRRKGLVASDERTSWSVYDFTTRQKLVSINENRPLQAASMIKPFVAQAFFYQHAAGEAEYDRHVRELMEAMIRRSSNTATNKLMRLVMQNAGGREPREVEKVLKHHAPGIFRETRIVETIPRGGRTNRNRASARDYSRFLYAIWNDRLPNSKEIKELMALSNPDRIRSRKKGIPPSVTVYDKTGTTARLCGNMGIVEAVGRNGQRYPYTFIAIIDTDKRSRNYGRWVRARSGIIREVSAIVYSEMKSRHGLV